jgi:hypothetical protein
MKKVLILVGNLLISHALPAQEKAGDRTVEVANLSLGASIEIFAIASKR